MNPNRFVSVHIKYISEPCANVAKRILLLNKQTDNHNKNNNKNNKEKNNTHETNEK